MTIVGKNANNSMYQWNTIVVYNVILFKYLSIDAKH